MTSFLLGVIVGVILWWIASAILVVALVVHAHQGDDKRQIAIERLRAMTFADVGGVEYLRALHDDLAERAGERLIEDALAGRG